MVQEAIQDKEGLQEATPVEDLVATLVEVRPDLATPATTSQDPMVTQARGLLTTIPKVALGIRLASLEMGRLQAPLLHKEAPGIPPARQAVAQRLDPMLPKGLATHKTNHPVDQLQEQQPVRPLLQLKRKVLEVLPPARRLQRRVLLQDPLLEILQPLAAARLQPLKVSLLPPLVRQPPPSRQDLHELLLPLGRHLSLQGALHQVLVILPLEVPLEETILQLEVLQEVVIPLLNLDTLMATHVLDIREVTLRDLTMVVTIHNSMPRATQVVDTEDTDLRPDLLETTHREDLLEATPLVALLEVTLPVVPQATILQEALLETTHQVVHLLETTLLEVLLEAILQVVLVLRATTRLVGLPEVTPPADHPETTQAEVLPETTLLEEVLETASKGVEVLHPTILLLEDRPPIKDRRKPLSNSWFWMLKK